MRHVLCAVTGFAIAVGCVEGRDLVQPFPPTPRFTVVPSKVVPSFFVAEFGQFVDPADRGMVGIGPAVRTGRLDVSVLNRVALPKSTGSIDQRAKKRSREKLWGWKNIGLSITNIIAVSADAETTFPNLGKRRVLAEFTTSGGAHVRYMDPFVEGDVFGKLIVPHGRAAFYGTTLGIKGAMHFVGHRARQSDKKFWRGTGHALRGLLFVWDILQIRQAVLNDRFAKQFTLPPLPRR